MQSELVYIGREDRPPGLNQIAAGKVRDIYELDANRLLFVTTDRVSAFDVVMHQGVPFKGAVLTAISTYWFAKTQDLIPNHLVSTSIDDVPGLDDEWRAKLDGRIMIVKRCEPSCVEWVVRGYIAGSGWKEYQGSGTICEQTLPEGLQLASKFEQPLFTPTTKADAHDEPISPDRARELVGDEVYENALAATFALFERGTETLAKLGFLLADTKFEFGVRNGKLLLIDEALTPDSSRFWPADGWNPGSEPPAYDKQVLRTWLEAQPWNKEYPPPTIDPKIIERVSARYPRHLRTNHWRETGQGHFMSLATWIGSGTAQ